MYRPLHGTDSSIDMPIRPGLQPLCKYVVLIMADVLPRLP